MLVRASGGLPVDLPRAGAVAKVSARRAQATIRAGLSRCKARASEDPISPDPIRGRCSLTAEAHGVGTRGGKRTMAQR
jgi:hypothetical protein